MDESPDGLSLNLMTINVPQSNVTEPNQGSAVTVAVFGNEGKNTAAVSGKASVFPPVLPTPLHFFARKIAVYDEKKSP